MSCGGSDYCRRSSRLCKNHLPSMKAKAIRGLQNPTADEGDPGNGTSSFVDNPSTILLPLKSTLLVPDLDSVIQFTVRQTTVIIKCLSELMNAILVHSPATSFDMIDYAFLMTIANSISSTFGGQPKPLSTPHQSSRGIKELCCWFLS